jgi:hypothetical protein
LILRLELARRRGTRRLTAALTANRRIRDEDNGQSDYDK